MRLIIVILFFVGSLQQIVFAQDTTANRKEKKEKQKIKHSAGFVDRNNDGYNDNAPDHDGDGIPNGLDSDYLKERKGKSANKLQYIDRDGDGINDNLQFNRFKGRKIFLNKNKSQAPENIKANTGNNNQNGIKRNGGRR